MTGQSEPKLSDLRTVGKAALKDFEVLGIVSVPRSAEADRVNVMPGCVVGRS